MTETPVRINLIGRAGSGKSTIATFLAEEYGFEIYRPSDVIREFAKQKGITLKTRQDYVAIHKIIHDQDPDAIIQPVIDSDSPLLLVDGMRAPAYIEKLQKEVGLKVIALDATDQERYQRVVGRARDGEHSQSLTDFLNNEAADEHKNPYLPNVSSVIKMADIKIDANRPPHEVCLAVVEYLEQLGINNESQQ